MLQQETWVHTGGQEDMLLTITNLNLQDNTADVIANNGAGKAVVIQGVEGFLLFQSRGIGEVVTKVWVRDGGRPMPAMQMRPQSANDRFGGQVLYGFCNRRR
jgi:hypothetical protein